MYAHYQQKTMVEYSLFPLWPNMFQMGYPIYADWSSSLFYPPITTLFFTLGPVQGLKMILLVHIFLLGLGFWHFSKLLTNNKLANYFGALIFILCGALAGKIRYIEDKVFTINDDVYVMIPKKEWGDKINLRWFNHQYQSLYYNLVTSKSDNATFNKEYAKNKS